DPTTCVDAVDLATDQGDQQGEEERGRDVLVVAHSGELLEVVLPGRAFGGDEVREDLDRLVAHDKQLHDDSGVDRSALSRCNLPVHAPAHGEVDGALDHVEGFGAAVRVR